MQQFLANIEKRAFRRAKIATGSTEDALDIVQDAMFRLVNKYADLGPDAWKLLFNRILQHRILDWHRRNIFRRRFNAWLGKGQESQADEEAYDFDLIQLAEDNKALSPEHILQSQANLSLIEQALQQLPLKQQQVFLLRAWEGLSEREVAIVMACSVGTVKTHYSRARLFLQAKLSDMQL